MTNPDCDKPAPKSTMMTIRIDPELKRKAKVKAATKNVSLCSLIDKLLTKWVENE